MSPIAERLREELLALPNEERDALIASVTEDRGAPYTLHPAWDAELRHRSAEYRAGRMEAITLDQFEKELDETSDLA
jgi:putative addiction module component (TIGR02574 family)